MYYKKIKTPTAIISKKKKIGEPTPKQIQEREGERGWEAEGGGKDGGGMDGGEEIGVDLYTSLARDVTLSSVCPILYSTLTRFVFKTKSILINEIHLAVYCSVVNYGRVPNMLC